MSENGESYTAGKNFALPSALKAWTNSTSDDSGFILQGRFSTWRCEARLCPAWLNFATKHFTKIFKGAFLQDICKNRIWFPRSENPDIDIAAACNWTASAIGTKFLHTHSILLFFWDCDKFDIVMINIVRYYCKTMNYELWLVRLVGISKNQANTKRYKYKYKKY